MTTRFPLVNVAGTTQELPPGDCIVTDGGLAAQAQLLGYTQANIAEVEAATKAVRRTFYPDIGDGELAYRISRHSIGIQTSHIATTTFQVFSEILSLANISPAICAINKIAVSVCTAAVTGTRSGQCRINLFQMNPIVAMYGNTFWFNPPIGQPVNLGGPNSSLRTGQDLPTLMIGSSQNTLAPNGVPGLSAVIPSGRSVGEITQGIGATVGTNVRPTWLFDSYSETPYILGPNLGLYLTSSFPAASTSQTINYATTIQWDEWQFRLPV